MLNQYYSPLRIGIFYEGTSFLHVSNYYNYHHPVKSRISLSGFHDFLIHKIAELENVDPNSLVIAENHYFRGRINASEASERGSQLYNDRVFDDILMANGIEMHYLPLRTSKGKNEEKGVNTWLSLTAHQLALAGKIDIAVFIFFDTEYIPLIKMINTLGVRTVLLKWDFEYINEENQIIITKTSHDLFLLARHKIEMTKEIEEGLQTENKLIQDLFVKPDTSDQPQTDPSKNRSQILKLMDGYGFIKYQNNNLFFHSSNVIGDFSELQVGDMVEFEIDKNDKGEDVAVGIIKYISI